MNHEMKREQKESIKARFQAFLANNDAYHAGFHKVKQYLSLEDPKVLLEIFSSIKMILADSKADPFSKILCLRLIKDTLAIARYGYFTLLNSQIIPILFDYALYRKGSQEEDRGRDLFFDYPKPYNRQYLSTIGYSFHKFALETIVFLGENLPNSPYSDISKQLNSNAYQYMKTLRGLGVAMPSGWTYYRSKEKKKLAPFHSTKIREQKIQIFYQNLLQRATWPTYYSETKSIIVHILQSGDQFCAHHFIQFIGKNMQKQQNGEEPLCNYMDLLHALFMTAQIEIITLLHSQLLERIVDLYKDKKFPYSYSNYLKSWGILLKNEELVRSDILMAVSQKIGIQNENFILLKEKFIHNCALRKNRNHAKQKYLPVFQPTPELLSKIQTMEPYQLEHYHNESNDSKIQIPEIIIEVSMQKNHRPNQVRSYRVSSSGLSSSKKRRTIFPKKNNQKMQEYQINNKNCDSASVKGFRSEKKNSNTEKSKVISCPSLSPNHSDVSSHKKVKSPQEHKNEEELKRQLSDLKASYERSVEKEGQLEKMLRRKQQEFMSISSMSQSRQISALKFMTPNKNGSDLFSNDIRSSRKFLSSSAMKIRNKIFHFSSYKQKRQILKSKSLLIKNQDLQIGIITNCQQKIITGNLYVTPFKKLFNIQLGISDPEWLSTINITNHFQKQAPADVQFIIKWECKFGKLSGNQPIEVSLGQLPKLSLNYKTETDDQIHEVVEVPVFITKFCEQRQMNLRDCEKAIRQWPQNSSLINIETRVLKDFKSFQLYFPGAVMLNSEQIYASSFCFEGQIYYLVLKILQKNQSYLKLFYQETKKMKFPNFQDIIFKGFCSLIGI